MCLLGLHVWAALRPHSAVYSQRFGQHGRSVVDGRLADAAVEGWQAGRETRYCDAIWWTERGTACYIHDGSKVIEVIIGGIRHLDSTVFIILLHYYILLCFLG